MNTQQPTNARPPKNSPRSGPGRASTVRRVITALLTAIVVVAGVAIVVLVWRTVSRTTATDGCTFGLSSGGASTTDTYTTDNGQAATAATMVGVVSMRALPERAAVLVLAAGLQESKLRNIPSGQGDRDSIGVLQQRPSQGWGTPAQLSDVRYATSAFLDRLVKVRSWQTRDLATVVQAVQISADASAYSQHEPQAQSMADALTGKTPRAIRCQFPRPKPNPSLRALSVRLRAELPVNATSVTATAISVPGAGWTTTAWFVANAQRAHLDAVDYSGWRWTRSAGWRARAAAGATAVVASRTG